MRMRGGLSPLILMPGFHMQQPQTTHAVGVQLGLGEQPFSLTLYFRDCKVKREMTHNNTNMHLPKNLKFVGHKVNLAYSDCLE